MKGARYDEFRAGWPIVLSTLLGIGLGLSPLPFYTIGVFAPHLIEEFHWTFGQVMAAIPVTSLVILVAGPGAGFLAEKVGAKPVAISSVVLFSIAFMGLGFTNGSLPLFYLTWALIALVGAGTLPITWTVAVNQWFEVRKGMALGIAMMGTGLFGFVAKPLLAWMIPAVGWRGSFVGIGLLPLLVALPAAVLLYRERSAAGLQSRPAISAPASGLTLRQALGQWRFWLIAAVLVVVSFALAGPLPNMENILKTAGFGAGEIVKQTSLIGLSALAGRFVGGWLLDLFWAPAIGLVLFAMPSLSCYLLSQDSLSPTGATISIVLIGFSIGVEYDLLAFMVARYFGMRSYTSIYGALYVFFAIGSGLGPQLFGLSFDRTGSYQIILHVALVLLVIGGVSMLALGRYRFARLDDPEPALKAVTVAAE